MVKITMLTISMIVLVYAGTGHAEPQISGAAVDAATREVDRNFEQEAEKELQKTPSKPMISIGEPEGADQEDADESGMVTETIPSDEVGEPYAE